MQRDDGTILMRKIDSHVHVWIREILSKTDIDNRRAAAESAGVRPLLDSPTSALLGAMRAASVGQAVVLPIDSGLNQDMPLTLREKTDWHIREAAASPDLITFVGVDPRRGREGLAELRRSVTEGGCRGWKVYPPNGFYPDDTKFYPYYELCVELGIPVVIHQGFTSRYKHVKYARPVYVDQVAVDFPELRIVLAHVGTPWVDEALMVAAKNPNVYVDVSGWQLYAARLPTLLYEMLAKASVTGVFPRRTLWGSDFPLFEHIMPLDRWASFWEGLEMPSRLVETGYPQVRRGDLEQVMWRNAARLFFGERP